MENDSLILSKELSTVRLANQPYLAILKRMEYAIYPAAPVTTTLLGCPDPPVAMALRATGVMVLD